MARSGRSRSSWARRDSGQARTWSARTRKIPVGESPAIPPTLPACDPRTERGPPGTWPDSERRRRGAAAKRRGHRCRPGPGDQPGRVLASPRSSWSPTGWAVHRGGEVASAIVVEEFGRIAVTATTDQRHRGRQRGPGREPAPDPGVRRGQPRRSVTPTGTPAPPSSRPALRGPRGCQVAPGQPWRLAGLPGPRGRARAGQRRPLGGAGAVDAGEIEAGSVATHPDRHVITRALTGQAGAGRARLLRAAAGRRRARVVPASGRIEAAMIDDAEIADSGRGRRPARRRRSHGGRGPGSGARRRTTQRPLWSMWWDWARAKPEEPRETRACAGKVSRRAGSVAMSEEREAPRGPTAGGLVRNLRRARHGPAPGQRERRGVAALWEAGQRWCRFDELLDALIATGLQGYSGLVLASQRRRPPPGCCPRRDQARSSSSRQGRPSRSTEARPPPGWSAAFPGWSPRGWWSPSPGRMRTTRSTAASCASPGSTSRRSPIRSRSLPRSCTKRSKRRPRRRPRRGPPRSSSRRRSTRSPIRCPTRMPSRCLPRAAPCAAGGAGLPLPAPAAPADPAGPAPARPHRHRP